MPGLRHPQREEVLPHVQTEKTVISTSASLCFLCMMQGKQFCYAARYPTGITSKRFLTWCYVYYPAKCLSLHQYQEKFCWLGFLQRWLFTKAEIHLLPHDTPVNRCCLIIFRVLWKTRRQTQSKGMPGSFWIFSVASGCTGSTAWETSQGLSRNAGGEPICQKQATD